MNKLNEIIFNNEFDKDKLYLLYKPTNDFGFFYQNNVVYFGKRSSNKAISESISTAYLDLNMNIFIESLSMDSSFESGTYDLLAFKGNLDNEMYFDIFFNICNSYCFDSESISFYEFFNSLVNIFKKDNDKSYKNLIGLIGELLVIKKAYTDYGISIANNWHLTGSNSKFDFSFSKSNLEIKSTTKSELVFLLKHSQIFNTQNNFVGVCLIIETGEGFSINDLEKYFSGISLFSQNVKFQLALMKEILKISNRDKERSFVLDEFKVFSIKDMATISDIPPMVTNIQYDYDFSYLKESKFEEVIDNF